MKTQSIPSAPSHIIVLLILMFCVFGCSRAPLQREIIPHKTVVVDFKTAKTYVPGYSLKGWWFSSRDQRRNPNIGNHFADILSSELRKLPEIQIYPRVDLKIYLNAKERKLSEEFSQLSEDELKGKMGEINPVLIARDLEADLLVTGTIFEAYHVHNRTIHWWQSVIQGEVRIIEIPSGEELWSYSFNARENFDSQSEISREIAEKIAHRLAKSKILR